MTLLMSRSGFESQCSYHTMWASYNLVITFGCQPENWSSNLHADTTYAKTWAGTILSGLGGTYELVSESMNLEQENKILNASLTYKEILSNHTKIVFFCMPRELILTYPYFCFILSVQCIWPISFKIEFKISKGYMCIRV